MLITVTNTATKLPALLSAGQQAVANLKQNGGFKVELQNLGSTAIYVEKNADAAVASGLKVDSGAFYSMNCSNLGEISLIDSASGNNNIRVIIS